MGKCFSIFDKSIVAKYLDGRALCLQATKRYLKLYLQKSSKLKRKGLIGLQDSFQDLLVLFNMHMSGGICMMNVVIVLLWSELHVRTKLPRVLI